MFGDAFDLFHDDTMDDIERIPTFGSFVEICEADVKSGRNSDYERLSFMDYDDKVECLEDLGLDLYECEDF